MRATVWVAPLAACMAVALAGCKESDAQTKAPAQPPAVSVVTVHPTSVPVTIELPRRTSRYLVAQVRARADGIVLKRDYVEGSLVKSCQRLYQIDPAPYEAQLQNAQA